MTKVVRTWDLCLLKTDLYFQKIKCATKQNANKCWNKHMDKEYYGYNYFYPEK